MPSPDEIQHQQTLLATHRRTLVHLLNQQATFGMAYVPPHISSGIDEARMHIARIKVALRGWHVSVEDSPNDAPAATASAAPSPAPGITIHGGTFNGPVGQSGGSMFNQPDWKVAGNVYNIAGDLNMGANPSKDEFLAALRQFKREVDKARDLPTNQVDEIQEDVDSAIRALDKPQPNKARAGERLENVKKLLGTMVEATPSALALGKLIGDALGSLQGLTF